VSRPSPIPRYPRTAQSASETTGAIPGGWDGIPFGLIVIYLIDWTAPRIRALCLIDYLQATGLAGSGFSMTDASLAQNADMSTG